ncbi:MAG TPA: nucleotidyltransferase domain-containing protein [Candidatus Nanoarchaeia archaeon]|nr:nucleotidyltransferase domain-containing protein [Candidatus Nanoarchaeia archaeon]
MKNKYFGYASQYVSFILHNIDNSIQEIILFGSAARGEATRSSDIDIFFSVQQENKTITKRVLELTKKFYATEFCRIWKNMGIDNEIKPIVGVIEDWNLKQSIIANGITLFGKYRASIKEGSPMVIIYWEPVKNQSKRVLLSKNLYGYSYKKKQYKGLLEKDAKLGANCIAVTLEKAQPIINIFNKMKIHFKSMYVGKMD